VFSRLVGRSHVVDLQDERVCGVVFAVDGAVDNELRERRRPDGDGVAFVEVAD